jgi:tellurite resistance protein TehA-like permease
LVKPVRQNANGRSNRTDAVWRGGNSEADGTVKLLSFFGMARESLAASLSPGCFAFVMATGIVSLAAHFRGMEALSRLLFWANAGAYLGLWVITLIRLCCFRARFISDLTHHSRAASSLTTIAGTCVLGCQFVLLNHSKTTAEFLWWLGVGLWTVLIYAFFIAMIACEPKPSLASGINGSWLLAIVATESISVLGSVLAPFTNFPIPILFVSLAAYVIGAMFYVFFTTLILYRWMFFTLAPEKFTPDYWIDMGALAISALAGSLLIQATGKWDLLRRLEPVLLGSAVFFWATSTWWIPLLLMLELWRHAFRGVRWKFDLDYWSLVFPLGMYAVATFVFCQVVGLSFLRPIADIFVWIALVSWAVIFVGMLQSLARFVARRLA